MKLNMRKIKLDHDVNIPAGSNSIPWTAHTLFAMGIYLLFGYNIGSYLLLVIVQLRMGLAVRWVLLLTIAGSHFLFSWIAIKCFDWAVHTNNSGKEHEEEEDYIEYEACIGSMKA